MVLAVLFYFISLGLIRGFFLLFQEVYLELIN